MKYGYLDSVKFTLKGLEGLVKGLGPDQFRNLERGLSTNGLLKKEGVFPYEFMSGFSKLKTPYLPPKKDFYSKLNDTGITDEQYEHAKTFGKSFIVKPCGITTTCI